MKRLIVSLIFVLASAVAWALPTNQEVEAAVQAGKYSQAESMMSDVVAAKPGSARAHYVYAEILARNANFAKAITEAKKARELDPTIAFTQSEKFEAFERMLVREQAQAQNPRTQNTPSNAFKSIAPAATSVAQAERAGGIPGWVWGVGLLVAGASCCGADTTAAGQQPRVRSQALVRIPAMPRRRKSPVTACLQTRLWRQAMGPVRR